MDAQPKICSRDVVEAHGTVLNKLELLLSKHNHSKEGQLVRRWTSPNYEWLEIESYNIMSNLLPILALFVRTLNPFVCRKIE